jgi:hypothetical protein
MGRAFPFGTTTMYHPVRAFRVAFLAAWTLSVFPASVHPAPPAGPGADDKAKREATDRRQKEHDDAVQKALSDYHKILGEARVPGERAAALLKLRQAEKDPLILSELTRKLSDVEVVRAVAIAGVEEYRGHDRAADALARSLSTSAKDPAMLEKTVTALGRVGMPSSASATIGLLKHSDIHVVAAAARALGEMTSTAAIEPLLAAWEGLEAERKKGGDAQKAAEERLKTLGGPLQGALQKLTGQKPTSPAEWRAWWIKNRSTVRLTPPTPVKCSKHF